MKRNMNPEAFSPAVIPHEGYDTEQRVARGVCVYDYISAYGYACRDLIVLVGDNQYRTIGRWVGSTKGRNAEGFKYQVLASLA